jgi:oligogalacturonide lyase
MTASWSRRAFLSTLAATAGGAEHYPTVASEMRRFRDPSTEFELTRLTNPAAFGATLPAPPLRGISAKSNSLVYCSDRTGQLQVFRMDLKSGESRQWTDADSLNPLMVSMLPDERSLMYGDGQQLVVLGKKAKTIYTVESGWQFTPGFTLADDGSTAAVQEQRAGRYRTRIINVGPGSANTIFEASEPVRYVRFRPKRSELVYNSGGALTLVTPDGRGSKRLNTPGGSVGEALWSADGRALHYLLATGERGRTVELRENLPETGEDKLIGRTTQFVSFARNADSSVFAGISGNKGAPYVLLLVRAARRELTLAEHRANSPEKCVIAFSANSQRLYFSSDREGKPAIYGMALDPFVEKTDTDATSRAADDTGQRVT